MGFIQKRAPENCDRHLPRPSALPLAFTPEQHEALRKFGDRVLAPLPEA
jgi:hypothetical protein